MVDRWASSSPAKKITRAKGEGIVVGRQAEAPRETMFPANGSEKKHASAGGCPDLGFVELGKLAGSKPLGYNLQVTRVPSTRAEGAFQY